jgi:hypothetical protein
MQKAKWLQKWGRFSLLRTAVSVCPHVTARERIGRDFRENLSGRSANICRHVHIFVQIEQK